MERPTRLSTFVTAVASTSVRTAMAVLALLLIANVARAQGVDCTGTWGVQRSTCMSRPENARATEAAEARRREKDRRMSEAGAAAEGQLCLAAIQRVKSGTTLPDVVEKARACGYVAPTPAPIRRLGPGDCTAGNSEACLALAEVYLTGTASAAVDPSVARNDIKGIAALEVACAASAQTCLPLATRYLFGQQVAMDAPRGAMLAERACKAGLSCEYLFADYLERARPVDTAAIATAWLRLCDSGRALECVALADQYRSGRRLTRDARQAVRLYAHVCERAPALAACDRIEAMVRNRELDAATSERMTSFLAAQRQLLVQRPCLDATGPVQQAECARIADLLERGETVTRDLTLARILLVRSCSAGSMPDPNCPAVDVFDDRVAPLPRTARVLSAGPFRSGLGDEDESVEIALPGPRGDVIVTLSRTGIEGRDGVSGAVAWRHAIPRSLRRGLLARSPDGRVVAFGNDSGIVVLEAEHGSEIRRQSGTDPGALAFVDSGRTLVTGSRRRIDVASGKSKDVRGDACVAGNAPTRAFWSGRFTLLQTLAPIPNVLGGWVTESVRLCDRMTAGPAQDLEMPGWTTEGAFTVAPNGMAILVTLNAATARGAAAVSDNVDAAPSHPCQLVWWAPGARRAAGRVDVGCTSVLTHIVVSADGTRLAIARIVPYNFGRKRLVVDVHDLADMRRVAVLEGGAIRQLTALAFSEDARRVVAGVRLSGTDAEGKPGLMPRAMLVWTLSPDGSPTTTP